MNVVQSIESQSIKKEYLPVNAFREGLVSIKNLTGREKHAKVFVIFSALLYSECSRKIAEGPMKNEGSNSIYGHKRLNDWFHFMETSLIVMRWIKKPTHKRIDLYSKKWYKKWIQKNKNSLKPTE